MKNMFLKTISLLSLYLLIGFSAQAQLSEPIPPKSESLLTLKSAIDTKSMPAVNVARAQVEDAVNDQRPGTPWRFALSIPVDLNLDNAGTWENLSDGGRVWRLQINSPGAISVNLLYSDFFLPAGATLHLYTPDKKQMRGAFTSRNNKRDRQMATALIRGESVVLEYYEPAAVRDQGSLAISTVNHGYRGYGESNDHTGNSGNCQVDINCSEGNAWQTIKKSVAKWTLNGIAWCSGALINNSAQDCRPLFLTADHCVDDIPSPLDAVNSPTTTSTLVFYWNFERAGCNDGTDGDDSQTTTGASILANPDVPNDSPSQSSDFALLLLDESPYPAYDVYFAGFNASGGIGIGSIGIHHPRGDVKKIATDPDSPTSVVSDRYWRIYWNPTANGWSVTEGGSSGSPLFNVNGQIIGQLFGGFDGGQPNCNDPANDEGDYGKLSYSWTNDGAADSRRRLFDHLDPVGAGANTVVAGSFYPCAPVNDLCEDATEIACDSSVSGTTGGSSNTNAPPQCDPGVVPEAGVWFTLEGTGQFVTIDTDGPNTDFDTGLSVYTSNGGCGGTFSCVTADDDGGSGSTSMVTFIAQAGTIYYIYLDGFGNSTGNYDLNISCCDLPDAVCQNYTTQLDAMGMVSISASDVDGGSTADCGLASLTVSPNSFECDDLGPKSVTLAITDNNGNSDDCTATVTVEDNIDPLINTCVGSIVVFNGEESFNSEDLINFAATDNCGIVSTTFDPPLISCEDLGTTVTVTVTVTDASGNSESCMADVVVDGLPCGFMVAEVGCDGDADYDVPTETFTLGAANCLYGPPYNQDELTFVKHELCGDGEIIAEVTNIQPFAWAGIIMRENLDQGSKKIALSRDNGYHARREARTATNGPAYPQQFPAFGKNWLRLVRQGNQFIGYVSPNGVNWQQVMVVNISMNECILVGLILTNKQPNQAVTADFRNVEVNEVNGGGALQQLPGVSSADLIGDISVYPNPTAGLVTVDLAKMLDKEVQLELRNTNGQILRQRNLGRVSERRTELQLGDLPVGIYWLRIQADGEAPITKRIVVQRP